MSTGAKMALQTHAKSFVGLIGLDNFWTTSWVTESTLARWISADAAKNGKLVSVSFCAGGILADVTEADFNDAIRAEQKKLRACSKS